MAYDKDQKEFPLPTGDESNSQRKTSEFLHASIDSGSG